MQAARKRLQFLNQFTILEGTSEITELTRLYVENSIVPWGTPGDAAHLAYASVHKIEFLCTWNLKHLANAFALRRLRQLNEKRGLFTPQVCTPEELMGD